LAHADGETRIEEVIAPLFALLTLLNPAARACEEVNLYNLPDSPLRKMPIYDQDGDGLCYAYTAAQLIDFHKIRENPDHTLTSAHWLAFAHKQWNHKRMSKFVNRITSPRRLFGIAKPGELGYSDINLALQDIEDVGTCDPAIVRDGIARFKKTPLLNDDEFLYLFGIFTRKVKENQKSDAFFDEIRISRIFHESLDELIDQRTRDLTDPLLTRSESDLTPVELSLRNAKKNKLAELSALRRCDTAGPPSGPALDLYESIKGAFDFDRKNKQLELLNEKVFADCFKNGNPKKLELPPFKHVGEGFASNEKILRTIDEALSEKKEPAAIGYCSKVLSSPGFNPPVPFDEGIGLRVLKLAKSENVRNCSPHYSVVVGRRKRGDECQYMIRNTYGPHFWNQNMDCTCENEKKEQFDCNYQTHGDRDVTVLGCWIPGKKLAQSSFNVTAFK
jgi:hypothetical protein